MGVNGLMERFKVAQVAEDLKLSKVSVHKWVKRLTLLEKGLAYKENGTVYLKPEGVEAIKVNSRVYSNFALENASDSKINPCKPPIKLNDKVCVNLSQETITKYPVDQAIDSHKSDVNLFDRLTERFTSEVNFLKSELGKKDETINRLLTTQGEERQRTDTIIMKLTNDVGNLQKLIEYKAQVKEKNTFEVLQKTVPVVQAWKPAPLRDPLEGMSIFQRVIVRFFRPERLRRFEF
jgi:hypothetical protein